jgi:predicted outer membrane protein
MAIASIGLDTTNQWRRRMDRTPTTLHIAQAALAIALGFALAGCNRKTPDDGTAAASTALPPVASAPPPMETTTALPPETTAMPPATTTMPPATTTGMPPAAGAMLNDADKAFLADVVRSNEEEIATTELAMSSGGAKAKEVSQMLNTDHVALRGEIATLAPSMPAPPGKAPASLAGVKAGAFDGRLFATYVDQHQAAIAAFTKASKNTALSEPVRSLATNTLPKLQQHLKAVKDAQRTS